MEFSKKLQELRKQKGITQQQLAEALFVSRTAISKWESGRGYPNIDSLKAMANYFDISVDALLSSDVLLDLAEEEMQKKLRLCDVVYGLLDCCAALLFFLPVFAEKGADVIREVSLLQLYSIAPWLRTVYILLTASVATWGVLTLALQNCGHKFWVKSKGRISLCLSSALTVLFMVSLQPYGAAMIFAALIIKGILLLKTR